jgi:glycine hydroxymethyltransferase
VSPRNDALDAADPEIGAIVAREVERQNTTIQLIASENFTSPAVMAAQGTVLTNKYSEGYPGKRYYGGNLVVDEAEELARSRACELFGAEHATCNPTQVRTRTWLRSLRS